MAATSETARPVPIEADDEAADAAARRRSRPRRTPRPAGSRAGRRGGTRPSSEPRIPVHTPRFGSKEAQLLARVVRGGWITSDGPFVEEFERRFSRFVGGRFGIATTSGTATLHLALATLRIGPGDEVIIPDCTMVACLDAVLYTGATPVLVDVDPATWTLDPALVESAITPRTRAMMPVHLYGHPAEMDRLTRLSRDHGVSVVEDAAEAHGSKFRGKLVGALGDIGCFSFYANKILTSGEGGMAVTRSSRLARRSERLRELAYAAADRNYHHTEVGFNYRLTDMQAAVGLAQLQRLNAFVRHRRHCAAIYSEMLDKIDGLRMQHEAAWARSAYWTVTVLIEGRSGRRDRVRELLRRQGIDSRVGFWPMHCQPFAPTHYRRSHEFPIAGRIGRQGLSLPMGNGITEEAVVAVSEAVRAAIRAST
jgi:perosamine synthetase